jgi:hypothetical protein
MTLCHFRGYWRVELNKLACPVLLAILAGGRCAHAGNIFDFDDPPATMPAATAPAVPNTTPDKPADPVAPTNLQKPLIPSKPEDPAPATVPDTKKPALPSLRDIPRRPDLERSAKLLNEAFAKQLSDKTPAGRHKLAKVLLIEASKASENASDQYALFNGALNAAKESASLRLVNTAVGEVAKIYAVDPSHLRLKSAMSMPLKSDSPSNSIDNVLSAMELVDTLIAQEDYTTASRLCVQLRPAATADGMLNTIVQRRIQEIARMSNMRDHITPQLEKLLTDPKDAAANLAAGSFECYVAENWARGLPMLAKGSDVELAKLAGEDLTAENSVEIETLLKLGDSWWAIAAKAASSEQIKIRRHAQGLYARCEGKLSPLQRIKIEKRAAELAEVSAKDANVLAEIAVKQRLATFEELTDRSTGKTNNARTPYPMRKEALEGDVVLPFVKGGYSLKGTVDIGWCGNNHGKNWLAAHLRPEPGVLIEGGLLLAQNGSLDLIGEPNNPIILRNVHVGCEYTANIKARYTIFENCVFTKEGAFHWNNGPSSKFEFTDCLVIQGDFKSFDYSNAGIRFIRTSFAGCKFPNRNGHPGAGEDSQSALRNDWSVITDCDFYSCETTGSLYMMPEKCNFHHCKITEDAGYQSPKELAIELGLPGEDRDKFLAEIISKVHTLGTGPIKFTSSGRKYDNHAFPQ